MGIDIAADRAAKNAKKLKQQQAAERKEKLQAGLTAFKNGYRGDSHVCTQCGRPGKPVLITKGSLFLELFLWFCFLLPGLIYSIWRHASRIRGCPDCRTQTMIRADSPAGKKLLS